MARGSTHFAIELAVGVSLATALAVGPSRRLIGEVIPVPVLLAFVAGYLFGLFLISPDLDLARNEARRRWGPLRFIWTPYHMVFRHRGISHSPLFGTATRLCYLGVVAVVPLVAYCIYMEQPFPSMENLLPPPAVYPLLLGFIAGCYIPNTIHVLVDKLT